MSKSALEYVETVLPIENLPSPLPNKGKHFVFFNVVVDREDRHPEMKGEIAELVRQRVQIVYPGRTISIDQGAINSDGWMINIMVGAEK